MNYKDLLKNAMEKKPDSIKHRDRFEIQKVKGHIEGTKTIVKNFNEIVNHMHRDPNHFMTFLLKELAAPGQFRGTDFIFGRKLNPAMINEKVQKYTDMFLFCTECGKPDTILLKEHELTYLKCNACGAKYVVKSIL